VEHDGSPERAFIAGERVIDATEAVGDGVLIAAERVGCRLDDHRALLHAARR
jgi:hypothetical protein